VPQSRRHPDRYLGYRVPATVRSIATFLDRSSGFKAVKISIPLSPGWGTPARGVIDMPEPNEVFYHETHAATLIANRFIDGKLYFAFVNTWGEAWGDRGWGYLHYEYVERYAFEAFLMTLWKDSSVESSTSRELAIHDVHGTLKLRRTVTRTEEQRR